MSINKKLNIFYEEPDPDRWFKYDRYPRKIIRRIVRGKAKPGGVMMVALQLMHGLDLLGIPYRFNDYRYARKNPEELIGIIGKPQMVFEKKFDNPILFGAGIYSHPIDCPDLFEKYPNVKKVLVPGDWMKNMFEPYYPNKVITWPVGIDTEKWKPNVQEKEFDFLIYNKIRWNEDEMNNTLISPIMKILEENSFKVTIINYGAYKHEELIEKLSKSRAAIFFCEHETQGQAYQQILSSGIPILAWERRGFWTDPFYYPHRVKYEPVSAVPYWDNRCGIKFKNAQEFPSALEYFLKKLDQEQFDPRAYILENLTLQICAKQYVEIYNSLSNS